MSAAFDRRTCHNRVIMNWLTFDYYGGKPAFLEDLDQRSGISFVGEIPRNFRCLTRRPRGKHSKKTSARQARRQPGTLQSDLPRS
jgi:hypothetical protein